MRWEVTSDLSIIAILTFDKSMKQIFFIQLVWLVPSLSLVLFCVIVKGGNPVVKQWQE